MIRFRAWHKKEKKMFDVISINFHLDGTINTVMLYKDGWEFLTDGINVILMQSTGLKDKNGKEIFEGDILKYRFTDNNTTKQCIVEWSKCHGSFMLFGIEPWLVSVNTILSELELIGNIYENTELMK